MSADEYGKTWGPWGPEMVLGTVARECCLLGRMQPSLRDMDRSVGARGAGLRGESVPGEVRVDVLEAQGSQLLDG